MTKVRTVVPPNAKPGKSIIQVTHPKTGKAVRSTVPKDATPGQMIELEIPDPPESPQQSKPEQSKLELPPSTSASVKPVDRDVSEPKDSPQGAVDPISESKAVPEVPQLQADAPVENTIYYQQQTQPVYVQPVMGQQPVYVQPVASQPVYVQPVATQPMVVQQPVVYQQKPNVVVVHEQKNGINEDDFCAGMCAACACTWLLLALSGK